MALKVLMTDCNTSEITYPFSDVFRALTPLLVGWLVELQIFVTHWASCKNILVFSS